MSPEQCLLLVEKKYEDFLMDVLLKCVGTGMLMS